MQTRLWGFLVLSLLVTHTTLARPDKALLKSYKKAKKQYANREYAAAEATLEPLINLEEPHELTPYALFYYALAAYHHGEPTLAEERFNALSETFPDWDQKVEVWYWLGQLRCEQGDYLAGWAYFDKVSPNFSEQSVQATKQHFLRQIQDFVLLNILHKQYPHDPAIAQALFNKSMQQPLIQRDFELLRRLQHDFNLEVEAHTPLSGVASLKKDGYNVAVFFPFFVDEVDYEEESSHQFVIALYQGIQAAVTTLAEQGVQINLFAYDTKKDPATTAALLEQPEVKGMDLIIGPLYAPTIPLVTDFARTYQINLFNPLSENAEVVGKNPFVYLFKPSLETQARKTAEFTLQHAETDINVGIIYGTTSADATRAHAYQQQIEQRTGKEVALMLPIAPEEAQDFLKIFREAAAADTVPEVEHGVELQCEGEEEAIEEEESLSLESLTHIYVASKDALIAANVLSAVEIMELDPCIIGHEAWIQQGALTFDQLRRLRLRLVAPNHIDYNNASIYAFRSRFYDRFAQYPDYYACTGYEMMMFLGTMLSQHGTYFQKHWGEALQPGVVFSGAAYGIHHDNQQVPILEFRNNAFVVCSPATPPAPDSTP